MEEIPGYSIYECMLSGMSLLSSFGIRDTYSDELVTEKWINLQKQYPYLHDYSTVTDKGDDYTDNTPLKVDLRNKDSIEEGLDELRNHLSSEIIKPDNPYQKKSLLAFAPFTLQNTNYTLFSLYTPHAKVDFKGLAFIVTTFLNSFEQVVTTYPMDSIYPMLTEKKLIPPMEEREAIIKKFFNYQKVLQFQYNKLREDISLTEEEKKMSELESKSNHEPIFVSETLKLSPEEMNTLCSYCKQQGLSIQALFSAAYLKASLNLFQNNIEEADVVNFQIIFDQRKYLSTNPKCIGLFPESTHPYFAVELAQQPVLTIAKQLTSYLKKITFDSDEFKRFRVECYYIHEKFYPIDFSVGGSNIGQFKALDDLTHSLKEKFVEYTFMAGSRYALPSNLYAIQIHMYSLINGSCNMSLSYPQGNVPKVNVKKLLQRIKEIMLTH